jgi:hypothetical protein
MEHPLLNGVVAVIAGSSQTAHVSDLSCGQAWRFPKVRKRDAADFRTAEAPLGTTLFPSTA